MGMKTENVEKVFCFSLRVKGRGPNGRFISGGLGVALASKRRCVVIKKALCLFSELCFLPRRGAHFHEMHEKHDRKMKNEADTA